MKRIVILLMAAVVLSLAAVRCGTQQLVILHTNDTHSQIETERVGERKDFGGVERRLQFIDSERKKYGKKYVLLLDAGDYNQGTPYFTMAKGDLEVELMNAMKYDYATLGNHEFDNGQTELARRLKMANHQTLCCNYDFTDTPLDGIVKPYAIVRRGGLKIGIIGATTYLEGVVLKSNLDGLKRLNTVEEINKYADYLKNNQRCDLVILLSHLGYDGGSMKKPSDVFMAQNSKYIDIIIGGHTHTFLTEATELENQNGNKVVITQAGDKGIVVGKLELFTPVRF
ncbi:MAG: bifunctional UDP-sugar hydrolase/5'-nucleotidase [Bacteroidales bacterium]|nr:bifunctional UDP-sugar hydrolase/5'-nucleotidase [Bacteroidales bacterium]MDD4669619.1 bifunctional UDP-sugar hydrolase/5'-nucleotidase [Bacteroidales bacterium]